MLHLEPFELFCLAGIILKNENTKSPVERLILSTTPEKRALTLLIQLWRVYDAGGISVGRSYEAVLLEAAIELLGEPDQDDIAKADARNSDLVNETRDYLSALRLKEYYEQWAKRDDTNFY